MHRSLLSYLVAGLLVLFGAGCTPEAPPTSGVAFSAPGTPDQIAPLLEGMGTWSHPVSENPEAQRYFDQGLILSYGFNHAEAERSFREAARRDPECAMCWWGVALVLGPNINAAMENDAVEPAWEALQKARELAPRADEGQQAYVEALGERYVAIPVENRTPLDEAYAAAMRALAARFPEDADAQVLLAEALMDLHPWDYWAEDGTPREWTGEILETLEGVLETTPDHPGAHHFYIHAIEASSEPGRALPSADRLGQLAPGAGHLVHMPSHIYLRVGRYHDAVEANQRAVASDDAYVTQCHAQGIYPLAYMPHNEHFLWVSATLVGQSAVAIEAAVQMQEKSDTEAMREEGFGTLQHYWTSPYWAWVRFGKWPEILAAPEPDADLVYPRGVWRFARGMAALATEDVEAAQSELAALEKHAADPAIEAVTIWDINPTSALLAISIEVLRGEIAARKGDWETALGHLRRGVELEDALAYDEPPPWSNPVRHNLGAVLLAAGQTAEAEAVYRADLEKHPDNGWGLFGLQQSLEDQGRASEAAEVRKRWKEIWARADIELESSRI